MHQAVGNIRRAAARKSRQYAPGSKNTPELGPPSAFYCLPSAFRRLARNMRVGEFPNRAERAPDAIGIAPRPETLANRVGSVALSRRRQSAALALS